MLYTRRQVTVGGTVCAVSQRLPRPEHEITASLSHTGTHPAHVDIHVPHRTSPTSVYPEIRGMRWAGDGVHKARHTSFFSSALGFTATGHCHSASQLQAPGLPLMK